MSCKNSRMFTPFWTYSRYENNNYIYVFQRLQSISRYIKFFSTFLSDKKNNAILLEKSSNPFKKVHGNSLLNFCVFFKFFIFLISYATLFPSIFLSFTPLTRFFDRDHYAYRWATEHPVAAPPWEGRQFVTNLPLHSSISLRLLHLPRLTWRNAQSARSPRRAQSSRGTRSSSIRKRIKTWLTKWV